MTVPEPKSGNSPGIALVVALIIVICSIGSMYAGAHLSGFLLPLSKPEPAPISPIPAQTPTPTPTPVIPQTVVFTVLTTSPSPHYSVTTTTGQVYFCKDYYDWNSLYPQDTYTAIVSDNMLSDIAVISHRYGDYYYSDYGNSRYYDQYPWYYEWNDRYYQYDGHRVDEISWKSMHGQYVRHEKPPYTNYGSANPDRSIAYGSGNPWQ